MRVILFTSSYPLSPEETFNAGVLARELALGLVARGHRVWVVTPRKDRPIRDPEVNVLEFPWWGRYRELATQSVNMLNLIRFSSLLLSGIVFGARVAIGLEAEVCLALWTVPSGVFAHWVWQRYRIPYGIWALGSDIWGRHRYPFGEQMVRRILRNAAFCVADGWQLAQEVERLRQKPCGFLPSVRRLPLDIPAMELPPARWHLLYLGRFEYQKGVDLLVEAMCHLKDELSRLDVHIYMLGDGSLRPHVEQRLRSCGLMDRVHLHGYASPKHVVAMMKAVHYLVIPSRIESIPLVFGDAMQCELPVIATDVGDLGMLVRGGRVGWVVGNPSVEALIRGLRQALMFPEQQAIFRSHTRLMRKWFHPDRMIEAIAGLLEGKYEAGNLSAELLDALGEA